MAEMTFLDVYISVATRHIGVKLSDDVRRSLGDGGTTLLGGLEDGLAYCE